MAERCVYKFGGASVKDAASVHNVAGILKTYRQQPVAVVISAMGKTTNALEEILHHWYNGDPRCKDLWVECKKSHIGIAETLFGDAVQPVLDKLNILMSEVDEMLASRPEDSYDASYDALVSYGELLSTTLISEYLLLSGIDNKWCDARQLIHTDGRHRSAGIDWETTREHILAAADGCEGQILLSQGFIGSSSEGKTTTLGREGSDFSAAIFSWCLDASEMVIWKDVPGMLNADPKWFDDTRLLPHISYSEAIELAYFGASVIHPKTIKPLQNKEIVLRVMSFNNPNTDGTVIDGNTGSDAMVPSFIFKINQVLISISPRDFSFIVEQHLGDIFSLFAKHNVRVNMMQNAAISFSVCVDQSSKISALISDLGTDYAVRYNESVELVTVRHYRPQTLRMVTWGKEVLVEQRSRQTARMVMRDKGWFDDPVKYREYEEIRKDWL